MKILMFCLFLGVINRILGLSKFKLVALFFGWEKARILELEKDMSFRETICEIVEEAQSVFTLKYARLYVKLEYSQSNRAEICRLLLSSLPMINILLFLMGIRNISSCFKKAKAIGRNVERD